MHLYVAAAKQTNLGLREGFLEEATLEVRESHPERQYVVQYLTVVRVLELAAHQKFLLYY